jgi:hypothetical protein
MIRSDEAVSTFGSLALHGAVIGALALSLPSLNKSVDSPEVISVDILTIDDLTQVTEIPKPSIETAPRETVEAPETLEPLPDPAQQAALAPSEALPLPDAKPQNDKTSRLDTRKLATVIDKSIKESDKRRPRMDELAKTVEQLAPAEALRNAQATATLAQAMKAMVERCWNPPLGGVDIDQLRVTVRIALNLDGTLVANPDIVSHTGVTPANQSYARAFAESTRRAILRCAPYLLPQEDYRLWSEQELTFDPSDIIR